MNIGDFIKSIELSPKYIFALFIVGLFMLAAGIEFVDRLGLTYIRKQFLPYISIVTLLSGALLVSHAIWSVSSIMKNQFIERKKLYRMRKDLKDLTEEEKAILRPYILKNTKTQGYNFMDGVVAGLEERKIIYQATIASQSTNFAYNIQPWAWDYLKKHPELLAMNNDA